MKTHRRFIAMLLACVLFLSCVPAYAITSVEKENNYNAAILQLETYLESAGNSSAELAGIRAVFDALGGYEQSRFLSYYTSVLMKIADEEYDYELYMFLDMLERNQSFNAYLKETLKGSSIGSVEELKAYAHGREYEHDGANSEAIACYVECLNYFDASARYFSLQQDKDQAIYNEAAAMLNRGDLAGAYFKFSEILRYRDSKERRDSIVSLLGYTPSSSTDNLEAVTGLKATEIKETEITVSWQKSRHASGYQVYYKQRNSNNWTSAGTVSETKKRITGLKESAAYDFRVIAVSGQVKKEALLTNIKTVSVTPSPKPTPTPKPTPKPTPTLKPTPKPTPTPKLTPTPKTPATDSKPHNSIIEMNLLNQFSEIQNSVKQWTEWDASSAPQTLERFPMLPSFVLSLYKELSKTVFEIEQQDDSYILHTNIADLLPEEKMEISILCENQQTNEGKWVKPASMSIDSLSFICPDGYRFVLIQYMIVYSSSINTEQIDIDFAFNNRKINYHSVLLSLHGSGFNITYQTNTTLQKEADRLLAITIMDSSHQLDLAYNLEGRLTSLQRFR